MVENHFLEKKRTTLRILSFFQSGFFLCFISGLIAAFGFHPQSYWWLFLPGVMIFWWYLKHTQQYNNVKKKFSVNSKHFFTLSHMKESVFFQNFFLGWFFGLGLFGGSLFWIRHALWIDKKFLWLWPFCVLGIPSVLSVFTGLWSGFFILGQKGIKKMLGLGTKGPDDSLIRVSISALWGGTLWMFLEQVRGSALTGFPWNLTAYIWSKNLIICQIVAFVGSYGLGFLTIFVLGWLTETLWSVLSPWHNLIYQGSSFCQPQNKHPLLEKKAGPQKFLKKYFSFIFMALLMGKGALSLFQSLKNRLSDNPTSFHENINLRLVQPNIEQTLKNDHETCLVQLKCLLNLSNQSKTSRRPITHVIWPESAFPYVFSSEILKSSVSPYLKTPKGVPLIMGAVRRTWSKKDPYQLMNSIIVLYKDRVISTYDKVHLLPFGEYVPFRQTFEKIAPKSWLKKLTPGDQDFTPGRSSASITIPNSSPCQPFICYEMIFPELTYPKEDSIEKYQKEPAPLSPYKEKQLQDLKAIMTKQGMLGIWFDKRVKAIMKSRWMLCLTNDGWFGKSWGPYQHFTSARFRAIEKGIPLVRVANTGITATVDPLGRIIAQAPMYTKYTLDTPLPYALESRTTYSFQEDRRLWRGVLLCWVLMALWVGLSVLLLKLWKKLLQLWRKLLGLLNTLKSLKKNGKSKKADKE
jgi:apolipoprotein N-acyltransferase